MHLLLCNATLCTSQYMAWMTMLNKTKVNNQTKSRTRHIEFSMRLGIHKGKRTSYVSSGQVSQNTLTGKYVICAYLVRIHYITRLCFTHKCLHDKISIITTYLDYGFTDWFTRNQEKMHILFVSFVVLTELMQI